MYLRLLSILTLLSISTDSISYNSIVSDNSVIVEEYVEDTTECNTPIEDFESAGSSGINVNEEDVKSDLKLKASVCTEQSSEYLMSPTVTNGITHYIRTVHGDWASVPELINYVNHKGNYTLAYSDSDYVYVDTLSDNLTLSESIKIKKKFPLLGDVLDDSSGNIYIVWGQEDTARTVGFTTMAISKYSKDGNHIKTTKFNTKEFTSSSDYFQTKVPFANGSCDTTIVGNTLIASFGREMYNGHQSNGVIAVNMDNMSINNEYSNYVSHSFDQRVFTTSEGKVIFANHGDAYPRGFTVGEGSECYFHFYGDLGNTYTYSQLGDLCEVNNNIMYVGSAPKSMTDKCKTEPANIFVQLASNSNNLPSSVSRYGTSCNESCTDNGIVWLTDYDDDNSACNPKLIKLSETRIVLLWEKFSKGKYYDTYYLVIDNNGYKVSDIISLNGERLSTFETPVLLGNTVVWTTAGRYVYKNLYDYNYGYVVEDGTAADIHLLDLSNYAIEDEVAKGTTFKKDKFTYEVTDPKNKYVKVKSYSGSAKTVSIAKSVKFNGKNYSVTSIGSKALKNNKAVKTLKIGSNIKTIGSYAFYNCTKLTKVKIGKDVVKLSKKCFANCKSLKTITIKSTKLKTVGSKVFKGTNSRLRIKVPKSKFEAYKKLLKGKGQSSSVKILKVG